jgi:arabinogalactan oligomer/maltooligosaccharide transport system substrate-binding protein
MRIRTAGMVAAASMVALVVAGCGGNSTKTGSASPSKAAGGTLVIWADDQRTAALKPFADKFGKDNGVTVQVQAISKDLETNYVTASQSGKGPDIVVGAHDWIGNLVQNGTIDPVQLTDQQKAGFADIALKAVTFNGQVYGVPYAIENLALIRNTDLAPTAPSTVDDMVSAGAALSRPPGRSPTSWRCRRARPATRTTSTRCSPRAADTCSVPRPTATTTRRTSEWASRPRWPRSRRSPRSARRVAAR